MDFQMGFAHDVIMTEKSSASSIIVEDEKMPLYENKSIV